LEHKNSTLNKRTVYLFTSIFILSLLFIAQYKRYNTHKKRFNKIITNLNQKEVFTNQETTVKKINIDEELISKILKQLAHFETNNYFLKSDISINVLAKKFSTNTKYLSNVINEYKRKRFIHYINDLRIDYILKELKNNKTLQRYTIKSISEEAGFNTAESFATAFKKRTGLKPSYFIRNIRNS